MENENQKGQRRLITPWLLPTPRLDLSSRAVFYDDVVAQEFGRKWKMYYTSFRVFCFQCLVYIRMNNSPISRVNIILVLILTFIKVYVLHQCFMLWIALLVLV